MIITIQQTPDENMKNFIPQQKIFPEGYTEYTDSTTVQKSQLAKALFEIGGIQNVFLTPDVISVVKTTEAEWEELSPQIMAEILDFAARDTQVVGERDAHDKTQNLDADSKALLMKKIYGLVGARIRPALNQDGGDIEIKAFENGVLWVKLTGKCAGCPYAMRTLKDGVEKILKDYIPEVNEVRPAD